MRHPVPEGTSASLTVSSVGDIALRLPLLHLYDPTSPPIARWSAETVTAIDRLVDLIGQLQASANKRLNQHTLTPEVLLPYVLDEAQDGWEAMRRSNSLLLPPSSKAELAEKEQIYWLKILSPWLLWTIARCSHDTMRLLEGQVEQVALPKQAWQTGILRLVPVLTLHTPRFSCCIDLATYQQVPDSLPSDRLIRFKGDFCPKPTLVSDFVAQLTEEIQHTTPAISPFFQGIALPLLIPSHPWQNGCLQLDFAFEFIPIPCASESHLTPTHSSPLSPPSSLHFTHPIWIKTYTQTITQHYQQRCLDRWFPNSESFSDADRGLPRLVEQACWIADRLCHSWTITSRQITHQSWRIEALAARLMWCLMHSAYEVMQLMTGIEATVLQPQAEVCPGTLRWIVTLSLQTPEADWDWNVITGQPIPAGGTHPELVLSPDALIQTHLLSGDQSPVLVQDLEQRIWQQIEAAVPELLLLVQGAEIDLEMDAGDTQPAIARLSGKMILISSNLS